MIYSGGVFRLVFVFRGWERREGDHAVTPTRTDFSGRVLGGLVNSERKRDRCLDYSIGSHVCVLYGKLGERALQASERRSEERGRAYRVGVVWLGGSVEVVACSSLVCYGA